MSQSFCILSFFTVFILFVQGEESSQQVKPGYTLGQACLLYSDTEFANRTADCSHLRRLSCNSKTKKCTCDAEMGLEWDPNVRDHGIDVKYRKKDGGYVDEIEKGMCRLKKGKTCYEGEITENLMSKFNFLCKLGSTCQNLKPVPKNENYKGKTGICVEE